MNASILLLLIPIVLLIWFLCFCFSGGPLIINPHSGMYKVYLEASGEEYMAEVNIKNLEKVPLIDGNKEIELKQSSIFESFKGSKVYYTSEKVTHFIVQSAITSKKDAKLQMKVYKDGNIIYDNTISIFPKVDNKETKDMMYATTNMGK